MKSPILGAAYVARSVNAADNRCINLFPEAIPEGGKETGYLSRCPGLRLLASIGTGPVADYGSLAVMLMWFQAHNYINLIQLGHQL